MIFYLINKIWLCILEYYFFELLIDFWSMWFYLEKKLCFATFEKYTVLDILLRLRLILEISNN
jgi:hypothetical protein